ncbi:HPr-rel-A system PqqD family peptide chaperone [Rhodoferax ferrireducens]|uniref:HPr-rel-A system PqqD family peptide chaperone n=1 Tax=Rhodoferax ferrireducens TaxID=192843 RepID=UPI001402B8DC
MSHTAYKINPAASLHWASWDDEYVVFDEGSGQTHQMDSVRAFILNTLVEKSRSFNNLVSELTSTSSLADSDQLNDLVEKILNELCTHGLVEAFNE